MGRVVSNYVYIGVDRNGVERSGTIPGQATPLIWAETLFKKRWRSLVIKYDGEEVGWISNVDGHRTFCGEDTPRVRVGLPRHEDAS